MSKALKSLISLLPWLLKQSIKYIKAQSGLRHLGFFISFLMKVRGEVMQADVWHVQFVWAAPPYTLSLSLPIWPQAVWQRLVRSLLLAAQVFVCGGCLLLMLFDISAGVLSVWLPRCCSCSDILKGSSIWAAVNVYPFLSLSLPVCHYL